MAPDFVEALLKAAEAADLDEWVRVRLAPLEDQDEVYLANALLVGPSGSGAMYLGLKALQQGLVLDPDMASSFIVRDQTIQPTGGIALKSQICAKYGLSKLMIAAAEGDDRPQNLRRPHLRILRVTSVAEAQALGLGLAQARRRWAGSDGRWFWGLRDTGRPS